MDDSPDWLQAVRRGMILQRRVLYAAVFLWIAMAVLQDLGRQDLARMGELVRVPAGAEAAEGPAGGNRLTEAEKRTLLEKLRRENDELERLATRLQWIRGLVYVVTIASLALVGGSTRSVFLISTPRTDGIAGGGLDRARLGMRGAVLLLLVPVGLSLWRVEGEFGTVGWIGLTLLPALASFPLEFGHEKVFLETAEALDAGWLAGHTRRILRRLLMVPLVLTAAAPLLKWLAAFLSPTLRWLVGLALCIGLARLLADYLRLLATFSDEIEKACAKPEEA